MDQERPRGAAEQPPNGGSSGGGYHQGWTILSHLIAGPALFGAIGWALDGRLGTQWLLPVGVIVGLLGSWALIHVRFVLAPSAPSDEPDGSVDSTDRKEQHG